MTYYYFVDNKIYEYDHIVNLNYNKTHVPLTQEQIDFMLENPQASVYEIKRCQLFQQEEPIEESIEETKEKAIKAIDVKSRETLGKFVDVLGICNAITTTIYSERNNQKILTDIETLITADKFNIISNKCRTIYKQAKESILSSESKENIQSIVDNAILLFDNVTEYENELEIKKRNKLIEIEAYDVSENVNGFFLNGTLLWLDKNTRTGLVNTLNSAVIIGRENINIWFSGLSINLHIDTARQLLASLEIYATDCYNVTSQHKLNIENLQTIEEIDNYDITSGYPQRLEFNMNEL